MYQNTFFKHSKHSDKHNIDNSKIFLIKTFKNYYFCVKYTAIEKRKNLLKTSNVNRKYKEQLTK